MAVVAPPVLGELLPVGRSLWTFRWRNLVPGLPPFLSRDKGHVAQKECQYAIETVDWIER
jgi:hypothetical protein